MALNSNDLERRTLHSWRLWAAGLTALLGAVAAVLIQLGWPRSAASAADLTSGADASEGTWISAPGKVEPVEGERQLAFDTTGVIHRVAVREGDWVEAHQLLAELINDEQAARLEAARQELAQATARAALLAAGTRPEEIDACRAECQARETTADFFRRRQLLLAGLRRDQAVSSEEVSEARMKADEARNWRDSVAARLKHLIAGPRLEELEASRAARSAATAHVREAEAVLERTRLRAPITGRVLRLLHREGESVLSLEAMPILLLADTRALQIRAEVEEDQAYNLQVGQRVQVKPKGTPQVHTGRVTRLLDRMGRKQLLTDDPRERVDTRVLEVLITLEQAEGLRVHQRVEVKIGPPN